MLTGIAGLWCQLELQDLADIRTIPTKSSLTVKEGQYEAITVRFTPGPQEPYQYECIGHGALPCCLVCPWTVGQGLYCLNVKCKQGYYEPKTHPTRGEESRPRPPTQADPRTPEKADDPGTEDDDRDHDEKPDDPEDEDEAEGRACSPGDEAGNGLYDGQRPKDPRMAGRNL